MNKRSLVVAVGWLAGPPLYLALSAAVTHGLALAMLQWARRSRVSRGTELQILLLQRPVFVLCLFIGAFYATALAKPTAFGGAARILKHLAGSFFLGLAACVLPIRIGFMPLPDFHSRFAVSAFIAFSLGSSFLCFLGAVAVWIRLVLGRGDS